MSYIIHTTYRWLVEDVVVRSDDTLTVPVNIKPAGISTYQPLRWGKNTRKYLGIGTNVASTLLCTYTVVRTCLITLKNLYAVRSKALDGRFGEVCLNRFNLEGVNYDFLNAGSRIWNLYLAGCRSLGGYSDYLENTRSYFLSCFVVIPNLKDTVFGGVYGMDKTSDFRSCDYCAIERYLRVRSLGKSNK